MPNWVLRCRDCNSIFTHSKIDDVSLADYYVPVKPEFPPAGTELQCPKCGCKAIYQGFALSYED